MSRWSRRTRIAGLGSLGIVVVAAVVIALLVTSTGPTTNYYISLGDSLSVGIQPNAHGAQLKTRKGYTNDVLAVAARRVAHLKLVEMGCPGDTSQSLMTGHGNAAADHAYRCDRNGGSQLQAAIAFIRAHRSQVKLVSIDIGANDLISCAGANVAEKSISDLVSCVHTAERGLAVNLPKILSPLKAAVAPGTALVGGTIYDPFLVGYFSTTPKLKEIAAASVGVVRQFNQEITAADSAAGFQTADVAGAFSAYDTAETTAPATGGKKLPRDLVVLCADTWLCTGSPQGPNIHPNDTGYRAMGRAYGAALGSTF